MTFATEITEAKQSWQSPDGKVTIWEVKTTDDKTLQTMSNAIATVGFSGEVELYTNDKGKQYLRQPQKGNIPKPVQQKIFKADPERQSSIEWQSAIKSAVDAVHNWHSLYGNDKDKPELIDYKHQIVEAAITFAAVIEKQPKKNPDPEPTPEEVEEVEEMLNEATEEL